MATSERCGALIEPAWPAWYGRKKEPYQCRNRATWRYAPTKGHGDYLCGVHSRRFRGSRDLTRLDKGHASVR
jgi:hypothetical protein